MTNSSNNPNASSHFAPWDNPHEKPFVEIKNVSKIFGDATAVDDISLTIYQREFFALLGPSGCGKSTLLRMLAGFETPTMGTLSVDGQNMDQVPVYERPINMMFQSYALFPHMSVEQNIAFGLKQEKLPPTDIKTRTDEALELVQLTALANRKPHQLSGGQQQRTALARSLVKRPKLLLLDEPLGALDKKLREETQFELVDLQEKLKMTFVIVTHDQQEAMTVASRIAVLDTGKVKQLGPPIEVYEYPNSRFVAEFIGDVNIIEAEVTNKQDQLIESRSTTIEDIKLSTLDTQNYYLHIKKGHRVGYGIRPEKVKIQKKTDATPPPNAENQVLGTVTDIGYLGNQSIFHVRLSSGEMFTASTSNNSRQQFMDITWEDTVILSWDSTSSLVFLG